MDAELEALLNDIAADVVCGVDVSYDPDFLELETLARGKPAVQFRPDEPVREAEEPDWAEVEKRSLALLARSKHLRVALYLTMALLRRNGVAGLRDGLTLLHGFLERYWDTCYPLLDAEDNNDPTERLNVLVALTLPPDSGIFAFRDQFLRAPLCASRRFGRFGLRQVLQVAGELSPVAGQEVSSTDIDNAFNDTDLAVLAATFETLGDATRKLEALDALLVEKLGADSSLSFDEFLKILKRASHEVGRHLESRGHATGLAPAVAGEGSAGAAGAETAGPALSGAVNSTQDVLQALDKICDYYSRREPSSPIPLLLQRARRLVGKSFTDIIQDLSPEAMNQISVISGKAGATQEG